MVCWGWIVLFAVLTHLDSALGYGEFASLVKIDIAKNEVVTNETSTMGSAETSTLSVTTATTPSTTVSTSTTSTTVLAPTTQKAVVSSQNTTTTTPIPKMTTKAPPKTEIFETPRSIKRAGLPNYFCKCDLTINNCDLNCCCDIDCSAEMVTAFSCAEETFDSNDYVTGNRLLPCNVQGGLFCVARDRGDEALSKKTFDESLKKNKKFEWPEIFPATENDATAIKEQYKIDDLVLVYSEESKQAEPFELPIRLAQHSSTCRLKQPIQFLRDFQSICSVSVDNLGEFNINFFEKVANDKFLRTPQLENIDSDDYVNVTVQMCQLRIGAVTCSSLNKTSDNWLSILNVGHEISIRLAHNFTQITNATIFLIYDPNLDYELATIRQKFTVEFIQATNQTNVYPVSGNLGYLWHKPILVTKLTVDSNGTDVIIGSRLEFFEHPNQTFLKIPISRRNYCQLDDNNFGAIKFGENLFLRCTAPLLHNISSNCITPESNLTNVCQTFQKQLFHYLLNHFEQKTNKTDMSDFNLLISEFGNPKNNTQHWRPFKNRNTWLESIEKIKGTSNNDISLVCHNMMINVKYYFYYARLTVGTVKHQNLLKNAELEFGPLVNLQFHFDEEFKVPIYIQIQFHDLTSMATMVVGITKFSLLSCAITLIVNV